MRDGISGTCRLVLVHPDAPGPAQINLVHVVFFCLFGLSAATTDGDLSATFSEGL